MVSEGSVSPKSRTVAALLAFFLGVFGAHRFYTGRTTKTAIAMLAVTLLLGYFIVPVVVIWIWALVDFVSIVRGQAKDKDGLVIETW